MNITSIHNYYTYYFMKANYLILAVFLLISQLSVSHNDTISGVLLNNKNKVIKNHPVILGSVSPVTVKTDKNGAFTFANANLQDTLFVGDKKGRNLIAIPVNGYPIVVIKSLNSNFNTEYLTDPDEIVSRFLQSKPRDINKEFNTIRREDIAKLGCQDIVCLLSRMSGVTIDNDMILLRGGGFSKFGANGALLVVDGIVTGTSVENANSIPVEDLENITVLKDAPNYGTRGANGAILINTRRN